MYVYVRALSIMPRLHRQPMIARGSRTVIAAFRVQPCARLSFRLARGDFSGGCDSASPSTRTDSGAHARRCLYLDTHTDMCSM